MTLWQENIMLCNLIAAILTAYSNVMGTNSVAQTNTIRSSVFVIASQLTWLKYHDVADKLTACSDVAIRYKENHTLSTLK